MVPPSSTVLSSSAEVIPFGKAAHNGAKPPSFAKARDTWLKVVLAHPEVTAGEAKVGAAIFLKFNVEHYEKKAGELIAWPSLETLMAETRLSKRTVYNGIRKFERLGLLEVERSRYDHTKKHRAGNIYHVPPRCTLVHDQGARRCTTKVHDGIPDSTRRLDEIDSTIKKERIEVEVCLPSGPKDGPKEKKQESEAKEARNQESKQSEGPSSDSPSCFASYPHPPDVARGPPSRWVIPRPADYDPVAAMRERLAARRVNGGGL